MYDFAAKNRRRRSCRDDSPIDYRRGREARRRLANHGAFGSLPSMPYNECVAGTTGEVR